MARPDTAKAKARAPSVCLAVPNGSWDLAVIAAEVRAANPDAAVGAVWCGDPHLRPPFDGWIDRDLDDVRGFGWGRLLVALPPAHALWVRVAAAVRRHLAAGGGPVVVVEVVSPSSRGIDRGVKLASYFSLPSVRHYVVVDTDKRVVIHHRRDERGLIGVQILREGQLALDPPGLAIDVRDIFASI